MIECTTLTEAKIMIPKDKLIFRPSAYAIIVHNEKILLLNTKSTGKYWPPGGGLNPGESLEEGMRREVIEEAGIEIHIGEMVKFKEIFFYYEPLDEAYHTLGFFYLCKPKTLDLLDDDKVDPEDESEKPRWIDIKELKPEHMQHPMAEILQFL